eukprot:TRINITY_DN14249_c0_g1_i2.p2 TRINITY_DN14249_c0_g1~~TRINITY_DN14249_c0_g1_i2.p2  ORF type:complete len:176 (-),score=7.57 TRINITY_DN14249_c0_g1_i2:215-742(-)
MLKLWGSSRTLKFLVNVQKILLNDGQFLNVINFPEISIFFIILPNMFSQIYQIQNIFRRSKNFSLQYFEQEGRRKSLKIQCTKDGEVEQKKLYVHIFYYISAIFQKEQRLKTKTKEGAFGFFKTYIHYFNWGVNFVGADGWECTLWNVTFNANFGFEVVLYYFFVENGYIFMVSL